MPGPRSFSSEQTAAGMTMLLDALPDATAVLDHHGLIVAVNQAWRMFGMDNEGDPETTGVGVNYLDVCMRAAAGGCAEADRVATGLIAVLAGDTVESDVEYACSSPEVDRWFVLRIMPLGGHEPGALAVHTNVTRRHAAEHDLVRRASQDPLTGLANQEQLRRRLGNALTPRPDRSGAPDVGVILLDLDGLRSVNVAYGRAAGDELLQVVAARLARTMRPQDTVARLAGDQFAVVAPRVTADDFASLVARVQASLGEPYLVHGRLLQVGASVGSHLAAPGETTTCCLQRVDRARKDVKLARTAGA